MGICFIARVDLVPLGGGPRTALVVASRSSLTLRARRAGFRRRVGRRNGRVREALLRNRSSLPRGGLPSRSQPGRRATWPRRTGPTHVKVRVFCVPGLERSLLLLLMRPSWLRWGWGWGRRAGLVDGEEFESGHVVALERGPRLFEASAVSGRDRGVFEFDRPGLTVDREHGPLSGASTLKLDQNW